MQLEIRRRIPIDGLADDFQGQRDGMDDGAGGQGAGDIKLHQAACARAVLSGAGIEVKLGAQVVVGKILVERRVGGGVEDDGCGE